MVSGALNLLLNKTGDGPSKLPWLTFLPLSSITLCTLCRTLFVIGLEGTYNEKAQKSRNERQRHPLRCESWQWLPLAVQLLKYCWKSHASSKSDRKSCGVHFLRLGNARCYWNVFIFPVVLVSENCLNLYSISLAVIKNVFGTRIDEFCICKLNAYQINSVDFNKLISNSTPHTYKQWKLFETGKQTP